MVSRVNKYLLIDHERSRYSGGFDSEGLAESS
jgi:hypothetical protein